MFLFTIVINIYCLLTKYLSAVDASSTKDLFAARMLRDEGSDIVDLPVDNSPAVLLCVVRCDLFECVARSLLIFSLEMLLVEL